MARDEKNIYFIKDISDNPKEKKLKWKSPRHEFDPDPGVDPKVHTQTGWTAEPKASLILHSRMREAEFGEPARVGDLKARLVDPFDTDYDRRPDADTRGFDLREPPSYQRGDISLSSFLNSPFFHPTSQASRIGSSRIARQNPGLMNIANILNYNPTTSEIDQVRAAAMRSLDDPAYIEAEARAVAEQTRLSVYNRAVTQVARDRYDATAADELADRISSWGASLFRSTLSRNTFGRDLDMVVKERVDRVDLCALQVRQTLDAAKVREAYVDRVAQRADQLLGGKYQR